MPAATSRAEPADECSLSAAPSVPVFTRRQGAALGFTLEQAMQEIGLFVQPHYLAVETFDFAFEQIHFFCQFEFSSRLHMLPFDTRRQSATDLRVQNDRNQGNHQCNQYDEPDH